MANFYLIFVITFNIRILYLILPFYTHLKKNPLLSIDKIVAIYIKNFSTFVYFN